MLFCEKRKKENKKEKEINEYLMIIL